MPSLYRVDLNVVASAYIKAGTAEEALQIARSLEDLSVEDVGISGAKFDDPNLPAVSLSPAMTIGKPTNNIVEQMDA